MSNEKHKNLENLDLHTPYPTGVLLSRPTSPANAKCPFYYATDTNVLYWHNGSTWIAMTGVITPTIEQSMYTPFAINSGNVDSSGNADILEIDGSISGKLNFKIGGSNYISLTATTATGSTFTLSSISSISMATYADGTWEIFVNSAGTILVLPNAITRSKVFPASPVNGAVHLDTSKELLQAAKYDGSAWQLFNSVHLGTVVVASGVITSVITAPYNYNGYHVNKKNDVVIIQSYINGTEGYEILSDGKIRQWGRVLISGNDGNGIKRVLVTFLKPMTTTTYNKKSTAFDVGGYCYASCDTPTTTTLYIISTNRVGNVAPGGYVDWEIYGY